MDPIRLRIGLTILLMLAFSTSGGAADRSQEGFVDGLLQRRLYRLAQLHCEQQLERTDLDDQRHASLVVQLLKVYTQHAINVPRQQRQPMWDKADDLWSRFRKSVQDERQWPDVAFQHWIAEITRGEALRLEAEVAADRQADLNEATRVLRQSVRGLKDLEQNVKQLQRGPSRGDARLSDDELRRLLHQIQITMAQTLLQQAGCYKPESPDNVHLLSQARDLFASLARLTGNSELTQLSHLGQIECHRRLGDYATTRDELQRLAETQALSARVQWNLVNESAELKIDQNAPREAVDLLRRQLQTADPDVDQTLVAQTELTLVRAYVAAWKEAVKSPSERQDQWRAAAIAQLQKIERTQPKYWVRRAEILLSSVQSTSTDFADIDILSRSAAHHFRRKNYAEAINTFRRAANLARKLKDPHLGFDLDYQAAAVLLHTKDYAKAREAFRQVAIGYPEHINAARAHLTAITCAARLAQDSPDELHLYETTLNDQIRRWPDDPSADQARLWLAKLQQQQGKWSAANDTLVVINDSFPKIKEVRGRVRIGFEKLMARTDLKPDEKNQLASRAADYFEKSILDDSDSSTLWNQQRQDVAVDAATFRLLHTTDDPANSARYLDAAISSKSPSERWNARARALSGLAHLLIGDTSRASDEFALVAWSQIDNGLDFLRRLERETLASGKVRGQEIAPVMLTISRAVTAADDRQKRQLAQYEADALDTLEKRQDALAIYEHLVRQDPNDSRVQYRSAQLWEQGQKREDHQRAMDHWRYTVRLSKPASPLWFEAKLGIARTHLLMNDQTRAAEVIRLTQVLHPDLGGAKMKQRFLDLLQQATTTR